MERKNTGSLGPREVLSKLRPNECCSPLYLKEALYLLLNISEALLEALLTFVENVLEFLLKYPL